MSRCAVWLFAASCAGCTYDPPIHSQGWYENPEVYEDESASHPRREEFQAYLDRAVREGLPGAVLLVRTPDEGTWAGAAGWADIASRVPWQPAMRARVGSVSKMFSAAVVLQVCEAEGVSLDALAREHLPRGVVDHVENAGGATIRQLLQHTSGIFNYLESTDLLFEALGSYDYEYQSKERLIEYAYDEDSEFAPGASWSYSNTPYLMLEMIAERLGGRPSTSLMRSHVIAPLGLRSTSYAPSEPAPAGIARGYADVFADEALIDTTDNAIERFHFDGGVISNVYDLADFIEALVAGPLLSESARAELTTLVATEGRSDKGTDFYGSGLIVEEHPELGRILGHSGTAMGYSAHVYYLEDYGITFAAIVNGSQHTLEDRSYRWFSPLVHDDIVRLVVGEP